jgi:hypothetical protein
MDMLPVGENVCAEAAAAEISRIDIVQAILRANESAKLFLREYEAIEVSSQVDGKNFKSGTAKKLYSRCKSEDW